jgi:hypothetical protein
MFKLADSASDIIRSIIDREKITEEEEKKRSFREKGTPLSI